MTEFAAPLDALIIRQEASGDASAIRQVNEEAFGQTEEADLVEALRRRDAFTLSLVALLADQIVGHILFTPVQIESGDSSFEAVGLGPMAVLPALPEKGNRVEAGSGRSRGMPPGRPRDRGARRPSRVLSALWIFACQEVWHPVRGGGPGGSLHAGRASGGRAGRAERNREISA